MYMYMYNMYEDQKIAKKATKTSPKRHQKFLILLQNYPNFVAKFTTFSKKISAIFPRKNWLCGMVTIYAQHGTNVYGRNQMVPGL